MYLWKLLVGSRLSKDTKVCADPRALTYEAAMRKIFKQMDHLGSCAGNVSLFGYGDSGKVGRSATVVAAQTILSEQRRAIDAIVQKGGDMASLHWEFDSTPQQTELLEPETISALAGKAPILDYDRAGTRDVLVQRGTLDVGYLHEQILAKPLLLGDATSSTLLEATMTQLAEVGLDVQVLSTQFDTVVLHFGIDGSPTCLLTVDYIRTLVQALPNVYVMSTSICLMHGLNRITTDHVAKKYL